MVKDQGYDLDSLIYMCKDIRELFKELNLEKQEIFEVLENLKKAYDYSNGKTDPYNEDLPLKVTVTNACTKVIFYFTLNNSSKNLYSCDLCFQILSKDDLVSHVYDHENSS